MAPYDPTEHPFYTIAQNVFGGRTRDEALQQHQATLALERQRQLLRMRQAEADRVADEEAQRLGTAMGALAPSSTVTNPSQAGPVLQEPGLHIPGVTAPLAPPTLAETVFPGPSRATFGDEALRPQGSPGLPPPYPIKSPEQRWRDVYPEPPPSETPAPPEQVGGATMAEPDVAQTALPYTPAPYVPGGARTEVPGMGLDQLLRERPAEGRAYLGNRRAVGEVEAADVEATGRKAVRDYVKARKSGMTEPDALDLYGDAMEASDVGRKFLTSIDARQTKEMEQETKRRALTKEARAQQWLQARAADLRQSSDPKDQAKADLYESFALDPKLAERIEAHEKTAAEQEANRLKAEDLRGKPIEIGGIGYRWATNAAGERALEIIPGQQVKPVKSKWEGITLPELDAMLANPATAPGDRAIAQDTLARGRTRKLEEIAAANVPKPTAQTEKQQQERFVLTEALRESGDWVAKHPEWVGGTGRAWALAQAYDAPDPLKGTAAWLVKFPKDYDAFRATTGMFTAEKLNELAGAALTGSEIKRYAAFLPSVYTTKERFMASVETSLKMMEAATEYQTAREQGASVAEAQTRARAAIRRVVEEHVARYGDPTTIPPDAKTAEGAAAQLKLPRTRP